MKFSKSTGGFYNLDVNGDGIPPDAVSITQAQHQAMLAGQSDGKMIQSDVDGFPVLVDQSAPAQNIQAEIDALERTQLMPRATREFMLLSMESQFTSAQLAQNPGYQAVKAFDNQIAALRALL